MKTDRELDLLVKRRISKNMLETFNDNLFRSKIFDHLLKGKDRQINL